MRNDGATFIDICHDGSAPRIADSASRIIAVSFPLFFFFFGDNGSAYEIFFFLLKIKRMKIVWPRALIRGSTTTMWIESTTISRNVTVRLADDDRLFEDKTIPIFFPGLFFFSC
jgi:hypothetical protein